MKQYRITLNDKQMGVVQRSLEEYFRLRLGQDFDFSDDIAGINHDLSPDNPNHDRIFNDYILRRNAIRDVMMAVFRIAFGVYGTPKEKTRDMLIAEDIWDSIRVARGISRWDKALIVSDEPAPKIEEAKHES